MNMNEKVRVAIYSRVSTEEQATRGISLEQQPTLVENKLVELFGAAGYEIVLNERDPGMSGSWGPFVADLDKVPGRSKKHRGGLRRVLEAVRDREVDIVAVYDLSRIYRDLGAQINFVNFMASRRLRIVSATEEFDLSTAAGELQFNVLASIGQYSRKQNNERVKQNLDERKRRGLWLGTAPYGWRMTSAAEREAGAPKTIVPVPEQLSVVRRIKDLYMQGIREKAIADRLNAEGIRHVLKKKDGDKPQEKIWDWQSVSNILKCCAHAGLLKLPDGTYGNGIHLSDRAYDREDFERIRETMAARRSELRSVPKDRADNILSHLVKCGTCSQPLQYARGASDGDGGAYVCRGYRGRGDYHVYVSAEMLERAVLHEIAKLSEHPEIKKLAQSRIKGELAALDDSGDKIRELESRRAELKRQTDEALGQLRRGVLDEELFKTQSGTIGRELRPIEVELARLHQARDGVRFYEARLHRATKALEGFQSVWDHLEPSERRELLRVAIEHAEVTARSTHNILTLKLGPFEGQQIDVPRNTAARGKADESTGIKGLTARELAALYYVLERMKPVEARRRMGIGAGTYSALVKRACERIGEAQPRKAAKKAEGWIRRTQHLLPIGPWKPIRRSSSRRPTALEVIVRELHRDGTPIEEISSQVGLPIVEVEQLLRSSTEKEEELCG